MGILGILAVAGVSMSESSTSRADCLTICRMTLFSMVRPFFQIYGYLFGREWLRPMNSY
jgi:hypothetical protein